MAKQQNVVVLGLGLAGVKAALALSAALPPTHRVVAISETYFGFFPPASLRSAVVPGWEDKPTVPLDSVFPQGSRHVVLAGTKVLAVGTHSIEVDTEHGDLGFGREIPFEYAVIATGSTYPFPCRPPTGAKSREEVTKAFKSIQADVRASSSVLVVGGGSTGVEFAAEVAQTYPDKTVSLAHAHASLFDSGYNPRLGRNLEQQLKALGVHIHFSSKVDTRGLVSGPIPKTRFNVGGNIVDADYLLIATGGTPNSQIFDRSLVDAKGFIKVRSTFQLEDKALSHIYAIGDVTNVQELKTAANAGRHIPVLVSNVVASIKKGESASLKQYSVIGPMALITTGSTGGSAQMFGFVIGSWFARMIKSKTLLIPMFQAGYNFKETA